MKNTALILAAFALCLGPLAANASPIAPGVDLSLTSGVTNYTFVQIVPGTFVVADGLSVITATYVGTPLAAVFNVTDVCASIGPIAPCKQYALSITDANFAGASLGLGVSTYAATHTTLSGDLATVNLDGSLALGTDTIAFSGDPAGSASPVPEPGTLSLMATGLLGAAASLRRRFKA